MTNSTPSAGYPDLPAAAIPPSTSAPTSDSGGSGGGDGKAGAAKEQASEVAGTAADAGKHVAGTAKDKAGEVAAEARSQARDLYHQTRGELTDQAGKQQERVASGLRSVSEELNSMSSGSQSGGLATELVGQAATRLGDVASWLDQRDPGSLLDEVKQFAARRPGVFIGVAAAAGLLAGRLTRGITEAVKDEKESENAPAASPMAGSNTAPTSTATTAGFGATGAAGGGGYGSNVPAYDVDSGVPTTSALPGESDYR